METRRFESLAARLLDSATRCGALVILILVPALSPAQTFTTLLKFVGTNGGTPVAPLVQGFNGSLYGTTEFAGSHGSTNFGGTAFRISTSGTLTTLYNFCVGGSGNCTDGYNPVAGLAQDATGKFYGTATSGGANGPFLAYGTVFKLTSSGALTTLHSFCALSACDDGTNPNGGVTLASNGSLYGTTVSGGTKGSGTVFKMTTSGTLTTLHNFCSLTNCSDGAQPLAGLIQGSDGNMYGSTNAGGTNSQGTVFKLTLSGALSTLYSFCSQSSCADGAQPFAKLLQAADGNLYGTTASGGKFNQGTVFKITTAGKLTTLYSFCKLTSCADGKTPLGTLIQANDGNFYGTTFLGGVNNFGTIFELTPSGTLTTLYSFCPTSGCADGANPIAGLMQDTKGKFYGTAIDGGSTAFACDGAANGGTAPGCGTVFSLSVGLHPFLSLLSTSGKVGSKVGILGQGFDSTSVVKFNGVTAITRTVTGATYISATVPADASDGFVTVTTGATTLSSTKTFIVHNSWAAGAAMPTAVIYPAAGYINGKIYAVGGNTMSTGAGAGHVIGNNQVYNTATNTWSSAAPIPTPVWAASSAVVNGILYVIGGYASSVVNGSVQAYHPTTNTWTTEASMPSALGETAAVVDNGVIYVMGGGLVNGSRANNVEKYNPATNTWTTLAPLLEGKSEPSSGLLGGTIVAADGYSNSGDDADNEGYNVSTDAWSPLQADPSPRHASCFGVISGNLYVAGGYDANLSPDAISLTESFNLTSWTTLSPMLKATSFPASAVGNGMLFCFGGEDSFSGNVLNNVQVYQP